MIDWNRIEEISKGVDEHLRKLEAFLPMLRDIKASLDEMRLSREESYTYELQVVKRDLAELVDQLRKHGLPQTDHYEKEIKEVRKLLDEISWPEAVNPSDICDNEEKATLRAASILDLLVCEHMKDKKFLDYGCGGGHTIPKAKERETKLAIGYDVDLSGLKLVGQEFTSNFNQVKQHAPFDIVLLHDVLDHAVLIDPIQILHQVRNVLSPKGRLYVRNHPWSARHGGHLYLRKNKAFLHLIMDAVELTRTCGLECEPNVKVTVPLETYRYWFEQSNFTIISEAPIRDGVEEFFTKPSIINTRLKKLFPNPELMRNHLEISFVEYILEPSPSSQQIM